MAQLRLTKTLTSLASSFGLVWRRLSIRSFILASLNGFSRESWYRNQESGSPSSSFEGSVCGRRDESQSEA